MPWSYRKLAYRIESHEVRVPFIAICHSCNLVYLLVLSCFVCIRFQDLLFLACSHQENRSSLTKMDEWPEWILELLISNYEVLCFIFIKHMSQMLILGSSCTYNSELFSHPNPVLL